MMEELRGSETDDDQALDEFFEDIDADGHVHFLTEEETSSTSSTTTRVRVAPQWFPFTTLLRVKSRIVCRTIRYGVPSAVSDISTGRGTT